MMDARVSHDIRPRAASRTPLLASLERARPVSNILMLAAAVGIGRATLELTLGRVPTNHSLLSILTSVTFYFEALMLFASALRWTARLSWPSAMSVASLGLVLGLVPPLLDVAIAGPGSGSYSYYFGGVGDWPILLYDAKVVSIGETLALWLSILSLTAYTLLRTREVGRAILGFLLSYATVFVLAVLPELTWMHLNAPMRLVWQTMRDAREVSAIATQALVGLAIYLVHRTGAAVRISRRLLHAVPFLCLTMLGVCFRYSEGGLGGTLAHPITGIVAVGFMATITLSAIVSNDALDAELGQPVSTLRSADATVFACSATLFAIIGFMLSPRLGLPLLTALALSYLYHDKHCCGKARFPLNCLIEGGWAGCAFTTGYYCHPKLGGHMTTGATLVAACAFGAWALFSVFKDYKDVRFDKRMRTQTAYTIAVTHGWKLRTLHRLLVAFFTLVSLSALGAAWLAWGAGTGLWLGFGGVGLMCVALTRSPSNKHFQYFLAGVCIHVTGISWLVATCA